MCKQLTVKDIKLTDVPAGCLIEDWQAIKKVIGKLESYRNGSGNLDDIIEDLNATADCLAELITSSHADNDDVKPSATSLIAPGCATGILVNQLTAIQASSKSIPVLLIPSPEIEDIKCAAGQAVSKCMHAETPQCTEECERAHGCDIANKRIQLACGILYDINTTDEEELIDAIAAENNKENGENT